MNKIYDQIYEWIDRIWQWIAETVFVRFEFDLPVEQLRKTAQEGRAVFCLTHGGFVEWLILSSWSRREGLGACLVANRKRILLFAKPKYFFQVLFRRKTFADLFLSDESGPRLMLVPSHERKQLFDPTPVEQLLCEIYSAGAAPNFRFFPIFILWRKHMRGTAQFLSEHFFGLSSNPNVVGKMWYLWRKRNDSTLRALEPIQMVSKESAEGVEGMDETEGMRVAKSTRRRILVSHHQEMRVVLGPRYLSPHSVKETLMRDPEIQKTIEETAEREKIDRKKVMSRAYANLTEIVANYHYRFIEVMYVLLTWVFNRVFDGLVADEEELQKVRELMKTKPVVFIPCHRSHLDYLVLPYLFFIHDMVTPHIAAGVNLAFWPVGNLLRRGGGFFIRRSFRGDPLYAVCLRRYVQHLLQNRYNIKFFIEGTRSRSGKMLAPAYGMLKMVLETYQQKACDDIALVPVSLCYDEVPEQAAYTKELGGEQKVKESTRELFRSRKIMKRNFGKVYARFAPPLYAKNIYQAAEAQRLDPTLMLQKTAFQICKHINDVTPITPKSLVSTILLAHRLATLSLEEILRLSEMLEGYVRRSGSPLSFEGGDASKRAIEQTVRRLQKTGVASISDSVPRSYYCENRKRIVLNFYKNNAIHCLALPAITLLAFFAAVRGGEEGGRQGGGAEARFRKTVLTLRNILKFEFFFSPTPIFLEEVRESLSYFVGKQDGKSPEELVRVMGTRFADWNDVTVFTRLLGDLLESYYTVLEFLKESPERHGEKRTLVQRVLKYGEARSTQGAISFPESLSIQNYSNGLLLFENLKYLTLIKDQDKTLVQLHAWDERMEGSLRTLRGLLELMAESPESLAGLTTATGPWANNLSVSDRPDPRL